MRLAILVLLAGLATPALAESPPAQAPLSDDPALSLEAFDALTRGKTWDTFDQITGLYGIESFMEGRRVIWEDADGCRHGTWEAQGEQICFTYEGGQNNPVCWTYHDRGTWIEGFFQGDRTGVPIELHPARTPLSCAPYLGA